MSIEWIYGDVSEAQATAEFYRKKAEQAEAEVEKLVEALRGITVGKLSSDRNDSATAARLCGIARAALTAAKEEK